MTKLADAIKRSQRIEAAPMGFGAARPAPRPSIVTGGLAAAGESLVAYKDAGVEVVVLDARGGDLTAVEKQAAGAEGLVLGVLATGVSAEQAASLQKAGIDFLIIDAETTAAATLLDENLGYVLSLPEQADELFLRSLEPLALDAVFLSSVPSPLTVAGQLDLNRIGLLGRKPLIAQVDAAISSEDLRCLRAAGAGVLLTAGVDAAKTLKETVAALPPRKSRKEESRAVALPRNGGSAEEEDDDD